jgi:hypothetical protein
MPISINPQKAKKTAKETRPRPPAEYFIHELSSWHLINSGLDPTIMNERFYRIGVAASSVYTLRAPDTQTNRSERRDAKEPATLIKVRAYMLLSCWNTTRDAQQMAWLTVAVRQKEASKVPGRPSGWMSIYSSPHHAQSP